MYVVVVVYIIRSKADLMQENIRKPWKTPRRDARRSADPAKNQNQKPLSTHRPHR